MASNKKPIGHGLRSAVVGVDDVQRLTNKTFDSPIVNGGTFVAPVLTDATITGMTGVMTDANTSFVDDLDPTKILKFDLSGLTTGTTRTMSFPDVDTTLVGATGEGVAQTATVTLTATQVKGLAATPVTIVPAPGAGMYLDFVAAAFFLDYGTTAFAEDGGGSNLAFRYTDGSGALLSEDVEATGFINAVADTTTTAIEKVDVIVSAAASENEAIVLHNVGAGEIVTGDSVLRVKVVYRVWSTGF